MENKVILITGASSGIGKATAEYLAKKGHKVIGTSRKAQFKEGTTSSNGNTLILIQMDVTDEKSVKNGVTFIQNKFGRIDVLINNAGNGISGPIEETSAEDAHTLFNTNFFGPLMLTQYVLPIMRSQKSGLIITVSSIGGVLGLPYQGLYSASKFAIEGLTESLRMEVHRFGIKVVLIEPGDFKTEFTSNRKKILIDSSPYTTSALRTTEIFEHDEKQGTNPIKVAQLIDKIINSNHPRLRYRVGSTSQKFAASLKGVISDRIVQWILFKYYNV
jgi:short-subunit dehydrogenase